MPTTKIEDYEVWYSSNQFMPRIGLKKSGGYIGQLIFKPNGSALPQDTKTNDQVQLYYHLDDFQNVIDLLRKEKPIYLLYNGSGGGFENGITTV